MLDELAPIMAMPEGRSPKSVVAAAPEADGEMAPEQALAQSPASEDTAEDAPAEAQPSAEQQNSAHVHLASYRSEKAAMQGWKTLKQRHEDLLGDLPPRVHEVDLGPGKGIYFRIEAGPLNDPESAEALCEKLKTRNMFCTGTA